MNSQDEDSQQKVGQSKSVLAYCSQLCSGVEIDAEPEDNEIEESDCPICYESFKSRIVIVIPCKHYFCDECIQNLDISNHTCPMCRRTISEVLRVNKLIKSGSVSIDLDKHNYCHFNDRHTKDFANYLDKEWLSLARFMFESNSYFEKYKGMKGIEYFKLEKYDGNKKDKLLEKSNSHIVLEPSEGHITVVIGCLLPNLTMKLLITTHDDVDFEVDNDYADHAVNCLNKQIAACWTSLPRLVNSTHFLASVYIRKFERFTAFLKLCGNNMDNPDRKHQEPMKLELEALKKCNFDDSHFKKIASIFPSTDLNKLKTSISFKNSKCC